MKNYSLDLLEDPRLKRFSRDLPWIPGLAKGGIYGLVRGTENGIQKERWMLRTSHTYLKKPNITQHFAALYAMGICCCTSICPYRGGYSHSTPVFLHREDKFLLFHSHTDFKYSGNFIYYKDQSCAHATRRYHHRRAALQNLKTTTSLHRNASPWLKIVLWDKSSCQQIRTHRKSPQLKESH